MSALTPKADIGRHLIDVRFVPIADIGQLSRERWFAIARANAAKKATEKIDAKTSAVVMAMFPIG
jgi:hypothetical protein